MSHFYGRLQGSRGQATRCGTKKSRMDITCASWEGAVNAYAYYDEKSGRDMVLVTLKTWHGYGTDRVLYDGPISGK